MLNVIFLRTYPTFGKINFSLIRWTNVVPIFAVFIFQINKVQVKVLPSLIPHKILTF